MEKRRHEDRAVTLLCCGVSGAALVLGMWIAVSPLSTAPQYRTAGTSVPAEAR
jgi:hypothetical protein